MVEDGALLRSKSWRVGKNAFPGLLGFPGIRFSAMAKIVHGVEAIMNAPSGQIEGEVFDRLNVYGANTMTVPTVG